MSNVDPISASQAHSGHTAVVRRWRRTAEPTEPFFPWGLLPLLGLVLLALFGVTNFARNWIEDGVRSSVRSDLDRQAMAWAKVAVSGQQVELSGQLPTRDKSQGDAAIALARRSRGDTFFGALVSPTQVVGTFTLPPVPPPESAPVGSAPPAPFCDARFIRSDAGLVLRGEVPDKATGERLLANARAAPNVGEVRDELTVATKRTAPASAMLEQRALDLLLACARGTAAVDAGVLSLRCEASAADAPRIRTAASEPLADANARPFANPGEIGTIEVIVAEELESCDAALQTLLEGSTIEFASGSARIKARSNGLIAEIAEAASACPGILRIEGHTDDRGTLKTNMKLSQARAEAVRDALAANGLDESRLVAEGFGPTRPVAANTNTRGRRRNRRIEIRVAVPAE